MEKSWTFSKNLFNNKHFFGGKRGWNRVSKVWFFYFILIDQSISYLSSIMIWNKEIIFKIDLETLTFGMSCRNFLESLFLHVSRGVVVRILVSGAGGPGSNSGGVTSDIEEEGLWKLWVMHGVINVCGRNWISLIICGQNCHLNLLKFQKVFVET
jgi:hypothetical protein